MSHPYYPTDLDIVNYVPNDKSQLELLLTFGTLVVCLSAVLFRWTHSPFRLIWFVLCGLLHCGFELYWLLNRDRIASQNDLLAQLWKEYGKGDSRYMVMDKQLILLESLTIVTTPPPSSFSLTDSLSLVYLWSTLFHHSLSHPYKIKPAILFSTHCLSLSSLELHTVFLDRVARSDSL